MADNNLDPDEIRRLNEGIQELTDNTTGLGASFGSFMDATKVVQNSVSKLTKELDKLLKATTASTNSIKNVTKGSGSASTKIDKVAQSSQTLSQDFKGLSKSTVGLINQFNELGKTLGKLSKVKVPQDIGKPKATKVEKVKQPELEEKKKPATEAPKVLTDYEKRLRMLGYKLDENGKVVELLTKQEKEQIAQLEKRNKKEQDLDKKRKETERAQEEGGKVFKEYTDKYKSWGDFVGELSNRIFELISGSKLLTAGFSLLIATGKGLMNATISMTKDIYSGARGAKVSAKALKEFTDELGTATQAIGFAMMLIPGVGWAVRGAGAAIAFFGTAVKKAGEANEIAAEQTDKLFNTFNNLSRSGVLLRGGLTDVFNSLQKMGLSVAEIEQFGKILGENVKSLRYFGSTTSEGARQFIDVAGQLYKSRAGQELELLGVVAEEQRERALKFMAQETRLGLTQYKTQEQLIRASGDYIKELVLLQELTGATRQEQEEARNAVMAIDELRAAMFEAEQRGDQKELARLKEYYETSTMLMQMGQTKLATGVAQLSSGAAPTAEAAGALQSLPNVIQGLDRGEKAINLLGAVATDLRRTLTMLTPTIKYGGGEAAQGVLPGKASELYDLLRKLETGKAEGKNLDDIRKEIQARIDEMQRMPDKDLQNMVEAGRKQQAAAMTMDSVVKTYNYSATVNKKASEIFESAVNTFAKTVGAKPVVGGTPQIGGAGIEVPKAKEGGRPTKFTTKPTTEETPEQNLQPKTGFRSVFKGRVTKKPESEETKPSDVISFTNRSGSEGNFNKLNSDIKDAVLASAKDYNDLTGNKLVLNSAVRSTEEQEKLYNDYITGQSKLPAAKPGTSKHELGEAVDIQNVNDNRVIEALNKNGLFQTVRNDPVHFEQARYGGVFSGPTSGYPVMLHKDEVAQNLDSYKALFSDAQNSLTNYRNDVTKQPISSISPINTQPNAGKLLNELISISEDYFRRMSDELYKQRLLQEEMVTSLKK